MAVETTRKRKKNKKSKIVSFDNEFITKDDAAQIVKERNKSEELMKNEVKGPRKNKKHKNIETTDTDQDGSSKRTHPEPEGNKIEKRKKKKIVQEESNEEPDSVQKPDAKKKDSIREQKRKKHAKLLADKKIKAEIAMQQKSLNYLSKWKHSRGDWKFEKLRQVWLQQSLYDTSKIPNEFWDIVVEYFRGSKGHSRKVALDEAIKVIDAEENTEEENEDEDHQTKLQRARDIVQNLQE